MKRERGLRQVGRTLRVLFHRLDVTLRVLNDVGDVLQFRLRVKEKESFRASMTRSEKKSMLAVQFLGTHFFFSSCRARSRLERSSKRLVVDQLFSRCKRTGEKQKASQVSSKVETKPTPNTNTTQTKNNRGRHPET